MSYQEVIDLLPTFRQKLSVLGFGLGGVALVIWMVWRRRIREEHALLWFMGLVGGVVIVWCDPLLAFGSRLLGVSLPANALLLVAIFFLYCISLCLTSVASRNKRQIERLVIHVSIANAQLAELQASPREDRAPGRGALSPGD